MHPFYNRHGPGEGCIAGALWEPPINLLSRRDPGDCSAQSPFTRKYDSKKCAQVLAEGTWGSRALFYQPRTKGGEIRPPNLARDMVRDADEYSMKKDPFPPEGRGQRKHSENNNHGTKSSNQKNGEAEWAKPLYQHRNKHRQEVRGFGAPIFINYVPRG